MTAHKYADLFKAKLDNVELVLFEKHRDWADWCECKTDTRYDGAIFFVSDNFEYFLCLPKHKEACLHWLNGGEIQYRHGVTQEWDGYGPTKTWTAGSIFMQEHVDIRIKPRKEKRWIGYFANTNQSIPHPKGTKNLAIEYVYAHYRYAISDWQFIEIEVEV